MYLFIRFVIVIIVNKLSNEAVNIIHHNINKLPHLVKLYLSGTLLNKKSVKILMYHYLTRLSPLIVTFKCIFTYYYYLYYYNSY